MKNADEAFEGKWPGQGPATKNGNDYGDVNFFVKDNDVVVTKPDGTFITIMRNAINHPEVINARNFTNAP